MIELKNISGGYGKREIISRVSAVFPTGELTSIVGANGCGKSTLLMMCAGLIPLSAGEILLDGQNTAKLPRNDMAKRVSYLGQSQNAGNISVYSLVSHGRFPYLGYPRKYTERDREKIDEALALAGVADIAERPVSELSGGQAQRARLAMMLAQDTQTLLLDEPLTYLDISHQFELMELIVRLKSAGKTIIAVMHDLNLAFTYSDKIAVMENGKITAFGKPKNIAESAAFLSSLGVKATYCAEAKQYFFDVCKEK